METSYSLSTESGSKMCVVGSSNRTSFSSSNDDEPGFEKDAEINIEF